MKTIANMTLEQKIGQMLLIGYPGGAAGLRTLERVVSRRPMGNIILFSRNAKAPGPLRDELAYVRSMIAGQAGVEPLVSIDQEGGIVTRLGAGFTPLPGAMALAAAVSGGAATTADIEAMATVNGS
ncbi:MAG TPA: glycoside hydrolase family 3 N-terminal domain-containing protein, partial [Spirochaetales bacterium]|nr:glycoside hydrolase family 3 N-terminal domain-containing protein [Spirochaetales bacterium]